MGSKNNLKLRSEKMAQRKAKYKIKKLNVGVASVMVGALLAFSNADAVNADVVDTATNDEKTTQLTESTENETEVALTETPEENTVTSTQTVEQAEADKSADQGVPPVENNEVSSAESTTEAPQEQMHATFRSAVADVPTVNVDQVIENNTQSQAVTLDHGDNETRSISIMVPAVAGDTVTVTVPYIFTASTGSSINGELYNVDTETSPVADPGYVTNKTSQNTTFTYNINTTASMIFNLRLVPTVSDWSFLTPGSKFQVVVKKNGDDIGEITYTIGQPAEITAVNLNFDQNQTAENGLVKDQKYVLGVNLANNGQKDGDNFAGTVTLNVPKGFLADTTSIGYAYGLTDKTVVGDTASDFATLANGKNVTIKQAAAGEPVVIDFNNAKTDLLKGSLLLFGTYTTELATSDNNFDATVAYYSINTAGERAKDMIQQAVGTKQLNLAVATKVNNSWGAQFKKKGGEIYTDNGQADGEHQSDDTKLDYNDNGSLIRSIEVYNNGNVAQENVLIHLDIEPGTIMNGGEGEYALAITSSSENQPSGLTRATLTDGRTVDLQMGNFVTSNVNSIVVAIDDKAISAGVAKDGSNIKALDIGYKNIEAGTKVKINFSNNAILEKGTTKKVNDTAEYSYTVTSDKGQELTGKMSLNIKAPNPSKNQFTGNILNFNNTSYQPTSEDGGNIATITYQIRNIVQYNDIPSSYFIAIPQGFDLEDASQLHVYKHGGALYEAAVVEDLGYIGINGERMFKISLPETPWYRTPVLINGTSYTTPLQIVANKNQLPLSYAYPENGMSLFMELNENDQVSAPTNGFANISEVTLRDGKTYKVRSTNLGYYKTPNEVSYSFTYPSTYGQMNGIKAADAGKYTEETGTTKLAYSSSKELANSKGTIRLANVLTDKGISEYSYNVINLPSIANGDNATIVLTGEGVDKVTTTGTGNGQLLFAYTPFVGDQVTEAALVDFVTADQVTDWSKVKAVVLKSDKLDPSAIAMAELGFKITGIKDGSSVVDVTLQDHFTGEHENSTGVGGIYNVAPTYKLEIQRYVDVTTRWIDTDGNELQAPDVQSIMSGATYVTTGITRPHYKFVKVEGQPAGVTAGQDIVVTYIYEADKEIETQSVIFEQTINYVYAENNQSAAPTVTKTITFTRDKVNNLALNKVTYTPWMVDGKEVVAASFAAVISPEIKGYTADLKEVAAITVTPTDENKAYVTTVKYTKNPTENVTEDKTVTRTINYVYADGTQAVAPNVATKTFTRTGIKDTVTDEITWNAWSQAQEFGAVTSPVLKGYTADKTEVSAQSVTADSANTEVTVTYTKQAAAEVSETKEVTRTINYVYADGSQASEPVVETKTFTRTGAKDAVTDEITWNAWSQAQEFGAVTSPVLKGYTADKTEVSAQSVTADSANTEVTVTYTKQAAAEVSETKEVTRTINYVYADGSQASEPVVETKTFTRTGAKDAVTDEITWNAWSKGQEFGAVTSPVIKGYTADKAEVSAQSVTADSANTEVTVTYTKQAAAEVSETKEVTRTINYVYADGSQASEPVVETKTFTRTGAKDAVTDEITWNAWSQAQEFGAVTSPVLKGYTADKAEVSAQSVTADSANTEVTVTYTKQAAAEVSETKEVTRTINYVYADGSQASEPVVETKTFTRIGAKDAVTDAITWNAWSQAQEFGAVTSPVIKGYTADKAEVATQSVTADSANIEVTVTYTKQAAAEVSETKEVTRTINYVYADGLQALAPVVETKTFTRTGTKDAVTDAITWGAWSSAQEFASVMSPQISGYWADRTSVPATTVDHMSPDQVERVVYTANYSLTERFVDNMGNELIPSIVKKNLFVPGMDFDNTADAKVITGYVLQKIENGIGTFGEGDETTTFIYAKVGNIVPVDENGNALVPPVPYENDKDDPFGVTPHQKVPTIPGYKAEVEFVDPTDPTSDTIVKYVAEKTAEVPEVSEKQEPTKTKGVTVPTSQVGPKATTPVTDEAKVAELPQMGDDAKAQVTGVGAMLVALAGILGLGVKNKRKED